MSDVNLPHPDRPVPPASPNDADLLGEAERTGAADLSRGTVMGHPPGLFLLFLVEMWERFSYYGMRTLLTLYLVAVIAAKQVGPGTYPNTLLFEEKPSGPGVKNVERPTGTQARAVVLAVGEQTVEPPAAPPATGAPVLRITRARQAPDPSDASRTVWVPDDGELGEGVVVSGPPGSEQFTNAQYAFIVTNPSDRQIDCTIRFDRGTDPAAPVRTFYTINDNADSVTAEIKPDAERSAGEPPFVAVMAINDHDSGRNWPEGRANTLFGWYTGLAYLLPILGGLLADKLIGTHRSMVIGSILIAIGHVVLGVSGIGELAQSALGLSTFIGGLAVIVLGTGFFKPTVSVMVGQLYRPDDPRRDGAFTIFYMGINLGAFLCAYVCGTLGEKVGWHYGFGSAAVGMLAGMLLYLWGKPRFLAGIGEAPRPNANGTALTLFLLALGGAGLFALLYHNGLARALNEAVTYLQERPALGWTVVAGLLAAILGWVGWFLSINRREDRGPVVTIFVFMLFNAVFWMGFEQAGSSINLFTKQNTDRMIGTFEVPASWFQSVNAGLIFIMAPAFAALWTALGKRRLNPSQPLKIFLGLFFLGVGYLFMVRAGAIAAGGAQKASMLFILALYFWHTVGELCLSPTGLSYVTKAAPVRFVSLLMGIWFVSSFIANLGGGLVAAQVKKIEKRDIELPWDFGGQADFFFLFVVACAVASLLMLILTPFMKRLMRPGT
ncbi:MAG TPA: peptide MFS transporter [Phycisphaerales bacterium]|nr:peptide MFS transporter [Phycisphaerales bacterium]